MQKSVQSLHKPWKKLAKMARSRLPNLNRIETTLDVVEGMQFDKGYVSPYFITNAEKMTVELENASILITDKKLSNVKELVPFLEKVMEKGQRPLLIIAEDIEGEALATLVVNKIKAGLTGLCSESACIWRSTQSNSPRHCYLDRQHCCDRRIGLEDRRCRDRSSWKS